MFVSDEFQINDGFYGMPLQSMERRVALRVLHEKFAVPFDYLETLTGYARSTLDALKAEEGWKTGISVDALAVQLAEAFEAQLARLETTDFDPALEEKRVRALSAMAKTLETITQMETKLNFKGAQNLESGNQAKYDQASLDGDRILQLDVQIEAAIAALARDADTQGNSDTRG